MENSVPKNEQKQVVQVDIIEIMHIINYNRKII